MKKRENMVVKEWDKGFARIAEKVAMDNKSYFTAAISIHTLRN